MTVSSPEFDLIFGRISAKEERIDKLDRKIARKELRIAGITDDSKQTERLEAKVAGLQAKKDATAASIETLDALLPKDEITVKPRFFGDEVTGEIDWLLMEVTVQDSPYDDSLFPTGRDKGLAYTTTGRERSAFGASGGNWYRTIGTSDTVPEDAVTTFLRGSHASAEQWAMGSFTFTVWDNFGTKDEGFLDKTQLFQEQYDSTTYPVVIEGPTPIL